MQVSGVAIEIYKTKIKKETKQANIISDGTNFIPAHILTIRKPGTMWLKSLTRAKVNKIK